MILDRRTFLGAILAAAGCRCSRAEQTPDFRPPNMVYVFADQWRAQAMGCAGDPNAVTPHLDRFADESLYFTHAVSGCPVCTPYRASLMTGQYWQRHGLFLNDIPLREDVVTFGKALQGAGYDTGYIGKWHLDGRGRLAFTPPERRQGFTFWKALECSHEYNNSLYYADDATPRYWEGYDADAQTRAAQEYLADHAASSRPFALFLSWGPPHNPYETAPAAFRERMDREAIQLRPNVPAECAEKARADLAGYYAHMAALDDCFGRLVETLTQLGLTDNTLLVFTSDHGDMLYSQGLQRKQKPFDESIRVPFMMRCPKLFGEKGRKISTLLNTPDIMPTLLGLCGAAIPDTVEGHDFSASLKAGKDPAIDEALLLCISPFGEFTRANGGREYRGIRTQRHTYVRDLKGPWLLYDNEADPFQQENLCGREAYRSLQESLDQRLSSLLKQRNDAFEPGEVYIQRFGYRVDASGTVPVHS